MSTTAESLTLKQAALGDLEAEIATTRRVLERVPDEHLSWKPHEKSWTLGALAKHVATLLLWDRMMLETDELDLAGTPSVSDPPASREEVLRLFEENVAALRAAIEATDEEALGRTWTLRYGDRVLDARPRAAMIRSAGISHMIHHLGQLAVYLRLLNVPVPPIYGPSADEGRLL